MIKVTGNNQLCQLDQRKKSPHDLYLKLSLLSSFSVYSFHSVYIKNSGSAYGLGDNQKGQISNLLSKKFFKNPVKIPIKNAISAVCCSNFTIYMANSESEPQLLFFNSQKSQSPIILNIGSKIPVSLFGGNKTAAVIDSEGGIIVITESMLDKEIFTPLISDLPDNEKASNIACGNKMILVLTKNGKLFKSIISYSNTLSQFYEIPELKDTKIIDVAGTCDHFIAVTEKGLAFVQGSNQYCKIGLRQNIPSSDKFVQLPSLSNIKAAFTGEMQSFFLTKDGLLYGCGCSMNDQLFMATGERIPQISEPTETLLKKDVSFAIGGDEVSVAFVNCKPPPNSPNMANINRIPVDKKKDSDSKNKSESKNESDSKNRSDSKNESDSKNKSESKNESDSKNKSESKNESDSKNRSDSKNESDEIQRLKKKISDLKTQLSTQKESFEKVENEQKQKVQELESEISVKSKRISELERKIKNQNQGKKDNFSFDPYEKERKESQESNYFYGEDDEEYLKVIKKIGEGATSITFKVIDSRTQQMMCKKVLKAETTFKNIKDAIKEFEILHSIFHPCICRAIAINTCEPIENNVNEEENNEEEEKTVNTTIAIYLEFLNNGLKDCLSKKIMDNTLKVRVVIEIVHAMKYIHKLGMIHRDLKIENIMMNSVFEAKIVDFGLAKIDECFNHTDVVQSLTKGVGTLAYMSPEMINEKDYDSKTDVYSFGIVLYYIFTGNLPKYKMEDKINKKPLPFPKPSLSVSQFCFDLIAKCCKYDPSVRPTFEEILNEIRLNNYYLAPNIDLSIVSKRDKELDFFELKYKNK